jgi:thiazole synthase ThiGH ThiG subunit
MIEAIDASGAEIVTVAVRRVDLIAQTMKEFFITSIPTASFFSRIPPAATRQTKQFVTRASRAQRDSTSG